jgi:hypothetical protein
MQNYRLGAGISFCVGVLGYAAGFTTSSLLNNTTKKNMKKEEPLSDYHSVLNLTPHCINLYDSTKKFLFGIKAEQKDMQLRLVNTEESIENKHTSQIVSYNYEFDFTKPRDEYSLQHVVLQNNGEGEFVLGSPIPVRKPIVYNKVEGIEQLREFIKKNDSYTSIIVSMMVADYMLSHKEEFSDLKLNVLVPDSDPKSSVRDGSGMILGVKGFIDYGSLTK